MSSCGLNLGFDVVVGPDMPSSICQSWSSIDDSIALVVMTCESWSGLLVGCCSVAVQGLYSEIISNLTSLPYSFSPSFSPSFPPSFVKNVESPLKIKTGKN